MTARIPWRPTHLFALATVLWLSSSTMAAEAPEDLQQQSGDAQVLEQIKLRLEYLHYRKMALDDDFSSQLLDEYIEGLDPSKFYLTARDIAGFEAFRESLDEALRSGDLEPAYVVFRVFQTRREALWQSMLDRVETIDSLTFDDVQVFELDREELSWPRDDAALDALWDKRFKNDVLNLLLAEDAAADDDDSASKDETGEAIEGGDGENDVDEEDDTTIAEKLTNRYTAQLRRVRQVKSGDVFRIFSNIFASMYCPHTEYYPPLEAENFDIRMSLSFEGIGALLGVDDDDGLIRIERILPGGPAEADGQLKPGDKIVAVGEGSASDFTSVAGWRTDEAVKLIRGPKGSTVRLEIQQADRSSTAPTKVIALERDRVKLEEEAAKSEIVEVGEGTEKKRIGVITLAAFYMDFEAARRGDADYKSSTRDVKRLVQEMKIDGVDGLVVDLRNNGGGSLIEAHELSGLFLGPMPIVQIRDGRGEVEVLEAEHEQIYDGPLAVIVNRLSASASEIFAGAVKDSGRGLVLGTPTYGKGTVQNLLPLEDGQGQLKLTLAKFYRLSGESTQHRGVQPDIVFPPVFDPDDIGESSLENPLEWDTIASIDGFPRPGALARVKQEVLTLHNARVQEDPEFRYLRERYDITRANREETQISLRESTRRAEREEDEQTLLALENRRRVGLGLEPFASLDDLSSDEERDDAVTAEAARILADLVRLQST